MGRKRGKQLSFFDPYEKQLQLFKYENPIKEVLTDDFLKSVPSTSGTYNFFDRSRRLLYVGKAKNLRSRIGSYRFASPENDSRPIIKSLHLVDFISFNISDSEEAAIQDELFQLSTSGPLLNVASMPATISLFQHIDIEGSEIRLQLDPNVDSSYKLVIGPFKLSRQIFQSNAITLSILNMVSNKRSIGEIPAIYLQKTRLRHQRVRFGDVYIADHWFKLVRRFYLGISKKFMNEFKQISFAEQNNFETNLRLQWLDILDDTFSRKLRKKRASEM